MHGMQKEVAHPKRIPWSEVSSSGPVFPPSEEKQLRTLPEQKPAKRTQSSEEREGFAGEYRGSECCI